MVLLLLLLLAGLIIVLFGGDLSGMLGAILVVYEDGTLGDSTARSFSFFLSKLTASPLFRNQN
jgi:hypothetical protein